MIDPDFTHLHVHSTYSLLGATAKVSDLVERAAAEGFRRLALTDTNGLYGAVVFSRACKKAGLSPITGMALSIDPLGVPIQAGGRSPGMLVLLATGPEGYRSLCRLSSALQGHPDREARIAHGLTSEDLEANRESLICLTGGRRGWLYRALASGDTKNARQFAGRLASIFDRNLFLGLELHGERERTIARELTEIGERLGIPTVAAQPVYTMNPDDRPKLRLLAAIDLNCTLDEVPENHLPSQGDPEVSVHWLDEAEIARRYAEFPQALENGGRVASRCSPALPSGEPIWPVLKLPPGTTPDEALEAAAREGLAAKYPEEDPYIEKRLSHELEAITTYGFAPLFLIVADIVRFALEAEVPVGTRGSVANSLVAYCIGITTVDPIEHGLLFERFLSPVRTDLPDIDLDFCSRRRDKVLEYIRMTYGEENVALVATVSTLRPRSAVRETSKAYGLDEDEIGRLAALVPRGRREVPTLEEMLAKTSGNQQILGSAFSVVGQPHHLSLHPGGVVITPGKLTDWIPLQWSPKGFLVSQFDYRDVEAIGLPKLDILGIRALTVLADTVDLVRAHYNANFKLDDIPPEDPVTGDLLHRGASIGVFQAESWGAIRTLRRVKANTIADLAVANAFFRPGPMMGGMGKSFIRRLRGEEAVTYLHPALEPILRPTRGVIIFQEQVLRITREIAGLSWEQADQLRRGISKHGAEDPEMLEGAFIEGCQRQPPEGAGLTRAQAGKLWEQVLAFSGFGFNQGHATAYAQVSYRSAYMKAHWPAAFICARLADRGGYHHPAVYIAEAVRLGVAVHPPHVNQSNAKFALGWDPSGREELWMGLDQVRDLRQATIETIVEERERTPFESLRDVMARVPFQGKEIAHLAQCGGLDGLGVSRSANRSASRSAMLAKAERIKSAGSERQMAFDFDEPEVPAESPAQALKWEREVLGQPVSVHPLDVVEVPTGTTPLRELDDQERQNFTVVGVRLPGWTGGGGFYLADRETYVMVQLRDNLRMPKTWSPITLQGSWVGDGMDSYWFQAGRISPIVAGL